MRNVEPRSTFYWAGTSGARGEGLKGFGEVVDEILGQVLRNAVWERLDMLAESEGDDVPAPAADGDGGILRLVDGWRSLLAAHEPDKHGDCPECSSRWRRQRSPCAVWRSAYEHLVDGGLAPRPTKQEGPGVGRSPARRRMATAQ
jgi:hypothetical protein